jgi:bifunctional UDP-N-acetylglucosamine pyrophosphorylase/glucosamine-1-phosphate N-acetyltransferase
MFDDVESELKNLSSAFDPNSKSLSIILAAGHGKRIKSHTPKMLHAIWGVPTVVRVSDAARKGLDSANQVVVVGINAVDIAATIGKDRGRLFIYQGEQKGTGHAILAASEFLSRKGFFPENIYIFPGDMGLITPETIQSFRKKFEKSNYEMVVLSGIYHGNSLENHYGRIIRIPGKKGRDSAGIIEIKEYKDIMALKKIYKVKIGREEHCFSKKELIDIDEFNTSVYALKGKSLKKYIRKLTFDNVQQEMYLTDLVRIFNNNRLSVGSVSVNENNVVFAFNDKSALKKMEEIARGRVYEKLKNIITFKDPEDFFIADEVVDKIIKLDREGKLLDIVVGKGVHVGKGVDLETGVIIKDHAYLEGNVKLGEEVIIGERVHLSTYPGQTLKIGSHTEILQGDIIKGNLEIGENSRIESSVNMTGSDERPTRIGNNVLIKGTSYVFGSVIDDNIFIEHSVLKNKHVRCTKKKDGTVQSIRYILPKPEGIDSIEDL